MHFRTSAHVKQIIRTAGAEGRLRPPWPERHQPIVATGGPPKYVIEPLDPKRHDRAGYSCGVEQVDNVFKKTADKLSRADNLRVFVMASEDGAVIGFCALNAHTVSYADLPERSARDRRFSGGGFGGDLLVDCLKRILRASESIGLSV